jgi:methionyl-tRNA formyltransferase
MLQNIILLTPQPQQQFAIRALFEEHNPALSFSSALTSQDLMAISPATLQRSRLIAFTSGAIVPPQVLHALGHGAYNFHPGPPAYPGWAPAHFALYERTRVFGATAHMMTERVDSGPIIGTETFIVPNGISVRELEQIAYVRLAYLLWRLAKDLATQPEPLQVLPIRWSTQKSTRRMYASMCDIPADISKDELDRRMRAFHDDFRGMTPTVTLHGIKFQAVAGAPTTAASTEPSLKPIEQMPGQRKRAYG